MPFLPQNKWHAAYITKNGLPQETSCAKGDETHAGHIQEAATYWLHNYGQSLYSCSTLDTYILQTHVSYLQATISNNIMLLLRSGSTNTGATDDSITDTVTDTDTVTATHDTRGQVKAVAS